MLDPNHETDPPDLGLRERNKIEKLQRIKAAARELFREKGFDETTTREIARRAHVGLGTLFLYASDKRDLLFLVYTDELESLTDRAFANVPRKPAFIDELVHVLGHYYRYFAREPELSRYLLRELTFFTAGTQGQRFQQNRRRVISLLAERVARAMDERRIASRENARRVAWVLFAVYQAEIREWLVDTHPRPADGLRSLRRSLGVVLSGVQAADAVFE